MAILCENTPQLNPEQWDKLEEAATPLSPERQKELEELRENTIYHADGTVTINFTPKSK